MKQDKISVLLPVYNTNSSHLKSCLHSIFLQTFQDFELVICNNGSTQESTIAVINDAEKEDRVRVINVPQQRGKKNLSVAINAGLVACKNELIARMDSDDIMFPERLERQLNYFNNYWEDVDILGTQLVTSDNFINVDLAYKNVQTNSIDKNIINNFHKEIIPKNEYKISTHFCNHPTIMFKKSVILDLGGYKDTPNYIPEDFCLWTKALKRGYKIRNMQEILLWYRADAIGLSLKDSQRPEWYQAIAESRNNLFDFERYI